jgi:electron transfer flavoprotein-quinone oxidoreductase
MADFDAIVVGSGCAGSVAAYELAKAGKSVLVIERGSSPGTKNMTGGRLYLHALREVFGDAAEQAPLERKISHEKVSMLTDDASFTIDFTSRRMHEAGQESYSVLRASFDPWLAAQAERAGAEYICGIAVEALVKKDGFVCGVRAGEDEISADVVILADGVNSLLTAEAVAYPRPSASQMAVGIKQVIELPAQTIADRLLCGTDEGAAWLFVGSATKGQAGGGFMYTNRKSISLGLVVTISALQDTEVPVYQMMEDFKVHPAIAPLIEGGRVVEHSGHMVPEGGYQMMPKLVADGVLLAGECAMMCVNLGYMVRGMDYAIAAGMHAGRTAAAALEARDTSEVGLASYVRALEQSFVLKDLKQFERVPHFMESTTRLYNEYPALVCEAMSSLFVVDGKPVAPLRQSMRPLIKEIGAMTLLKDAWKGVRAL